MAKLQLYTWYKIEDYTMFKNLVYEYLKAYCKNKNKNINDITNSKTYRCAEHICEQQSIEYIKILELHFDYIRYTIKFNEDEPFLIIGSDCEEDTNSDCEEKENKMVEKRQGAFTLLENYYNEKLDKIDEESLAEKSKVIENSDVYEQYKIFKDFLNKREKELNMLSSGVNFDIVSYLSIDEQSALKEITNYAQDKRDELRKERGTIKALLEMTNDYDKQIDILTRYGVITLPKKRK